MANRFLDKLAAALAFRLRTLRRRADDTNIKAAASLITAREIEGLFGELLTWDAWFAEATAANVAVAFQTWVRENVVPPDAGLAVTTLVAAVNTKATAAGAWIVDTGNLDRDGTGFPAAKKPTASGFTDKVYATGDTTGLQTAIGELIVAIDTLGGLFD